MVLTHGFGENKDFGHVAQLDRVPHYGCGGYRFESCRGHFLKALL